MHLKKMTEYVLPFTGMKWSKKNRGCRILEDRNRTIDLVRQIAKKYYPDDALIEGEIAQSGRAVQVYEITIEHLSGKEIQER